MSLEPRRARSQPTQAPRRRNTRNARVGVIMSSPEGSEPAVRPGLAKDYPFLLLRSPAAQRRLDSLSRQVDQDARLLVKLADREAETSAADPAGLTTGRIGAAFACSLLVDLNNWGASIRFEHSQLRVAVPLPTRLLTEEERARRRSALVRVRDGDEKYVPPIAPGEAAAFAADMTVRLVRADESSSPWAAQVFRDGVTTWSMPYRSREGRSARMVLMGQVGSAELPIGLLEVGDDAPLNPARDRQLGFALDSPRDLSESHRLRLADRFLSLRRALRREGMVVSDIAAPVEDLLLTAQLILDASKGRTGDLEGISRRKRHAYLWRLLQGEAAARGLPGIRPEKINDGLRALRDVTVPRVNTEAVVCGALPPFGPLLVGKLVAAMLGHPEVRSVTDREVGVIASSIFERAELTRLVPKHGVVLATTKGLYAGHSAQYSGVLIPGGPEARPLRLRHISDTTGSSTSHLSTRTMRLASLLLASQDQPNGAGKVSRTYGSGGAKRQRTIEAAAEALGLPKEIVYAAVSRPIYSVAFVDNLREVAVLNESPRWVLSRTSSTEYEAQSLALWKQRWLPVANRRVRAGVLG